MSIFGQARLSKRLLIHTLELERGCVDNRRVACVLREPAFANQRLNLFEGGIPHAAKEASDICEGLGDPVGQAECLNYLAWLLREDRQLEVGEEAASQQEYPTCQLRRDPATICSSKRKRGKAICHFETSVGIAFSFD